MGGVMSFRLDESIGYSVELTERVLFRELTKRFQENGVDITPVQWVVLYRLWNNDGMTQAEVSERTFRDKTNITRLIDLLVKKKLVERASDPSDRRVHKLALTESARELMKKLPGIVAEHIKAATKGISKTDLANAARVLERIRNNFG